MVSPCLAHSLWPVWDAHDRAALQQSLKCGQPLLLFPGLLWAVCVLEKTSPAPFYSQTLLLALQQTDENWRVKRVAQRCQLLYCVRKNSLQYSRHDYYRFTRGLVIFWHEPSWILQRTKNRKFCPTLQHCFLEMTSKGKHDTVSQLKEFAYRNRSLRW